jgi:hypothetical protein
MMGTRKPNKSPQNSQDSTSPSAVGKITGGTFAAQRLAVIDFPTEWQR